jgi:hypothetical protein
LPELAQAGRRLICIAIELLMYKLGFYENVMIINSYTCPVPAEVKVTETVDFDELILGEAVYSANVFRKIACCSLKRLEPYFRA